VGRGLVEMLLVNDRLDIPAPEGMRYVPPPSGPLSVSVSLRILWIRSGRGDTRRPSWRRR